MGFAKGSRLKTTKSASRSSRENRPAVYEFFAIFDVYGNGRAGKLFKDDDDDAGDATTLSPGPDRSAYPDSYSVRSATIGFTRVARRAGTKQEIAATRVRRPATVR